MRKEGLQFKLCFIYFVFISNDNLLKRGHIMFTLVNITKPKRDTKVLYTCFLNVTTFSVDFN